MKSFRLTVKEDWKNHNKDLEYLPKDSLVFSAFDFVIFLVSGEKFEDYFKGRESAGLASQYAMNVCLQSFSFSLSFESIKDELKRHSLEQIYSAENIEKCFDKAKGFIDRSELVEIVFENFKEMKNSKNLKQYIKDWKYVKTQLKQQIPETKELNDYAIMKLLRDCYVHNNEIGDNFQKRIEVKSNDVNLIIKTNQKNHNFKIDFDKLSNVFGLLAIANKLNIQQVAYDGKNIGTIYPDGSVDEIDRFQAGFIKKLQQKNSDIDLQDLSNLFPSRDNSFNLIAHLKGVIQSYQSFGPKDNIISFCNRITDEQPQLKYLSVNYVTALLISACAHYYLVNSKLDDISASVMKKTKLSDKNITKEEVEFLVSKLRNSLVHGRFFYTPYVQHGGSLVFYDEIQKDEQRLRFENLDKPIQDLYSERIKAGLANKKVKQLSKCAMFSLSELANLIYAFTDIYDYNRKQTDNINVIMGKFTRQHRAQLKRTQQNPIDIIADVKKRNSKAKLKDENSCYQQQGN